MNNESSIDSSSQSAKPEIPQSFNCKIIFDSEGLPRSSKQWTRAKRFTLEIREDGLAFGEHLLRYDEIDSATIHIYQSALFFEYAILAVVSSGKTYHFGIKYCEFWKGELPLNVERVHEESPYILFRRTLIVMILVYIFWEVVKRQ